MRSATAAAAANGGRVMVSAPSPRIGFPQPTNRAEFPRPSFLFYLGLDLWFWCTLIWILFGWNKRSRSYSHNSTKMIKLQSTTSFLDTPRKLAFRSRLTSPLMLADFVWCATQEVGPRHCTRRFFHKVIFSFPCVLPSLVAASLLKGSKSRIDDQEIVVINFFTLFFRVIGDSPPEKAPSLPQP